VYAWVPGAVWGTGRGGAVLFGEGSEVRLGLRFRARRSGRSRFVVWIIISDDGREIGADVVCTHVRGG
jgi:hypothetical protein